MANVLLHRLVYRQGVGGTLCHARPQQLGDGSTNYTSRDHRVTCPDCTATGITGGVYLPLAEPPTDDELANGLS